MLCLLFCFKQKTAYELRSSDWSSYVCSSHLPGVKDGDVAAFSVDAGEAERVLLLVQCRTGDPERRAALRNDVEALVRKLHGIECEAVLVPHNSLPQTSSGKLSRSRARQLYLDHAFDAPTADHQPRDAESVGARSDESRVGHEWGRTGRPRGGPES